MLLCFTLMLAKLNEKSLISHSQEDRIYKPCVCVCVHTYRTCVQSMRNSQNRSAKETT